MKQTITEESAFNKNLREELKTIISKNEIINSEPDQRRAKAMRDLFVQTAFNLLKSKEEQSSF
jgi:hypothetical protein